ncbi:MAG: hypothetical protein IAI48_13100, partial [Candidatus Eremiobacteraeota bacterium]|nr:hypothetical protein [Candidatus Eremiobacteraeota bacterium]
EKQWAGFIVVWDLDEGYTTPRGIQAPLLALGRRFEGPLMGFYRRIARQP